MSGISAQNSTLQIATGTGGAKTITAITATNPVVLTSVAHGFTNGTVVALAAIVGTIGTALLNGTSRVVSNVTADTYALLDANGVGLVYTSGGTATPTTYTKINGVTSFSGLDGAATDIDATDLDSTAMEYINGLVEEGAFSFDMKVLSADNGQISVRAARASGALTGMKLTFPNATTATFNMLVKGIPTAAAVNGILTTTVSTKISGSVVFA